VVSSTLLFLLGLLFYRSVIFAVVLTAFSIPCKKYYAKHLSDKRRQILSVEFKDLLNSMSSSFASGRQTSEAIGEAEENLSLIYEESSPILIEVREMVRRLFQGRESERDVLYDFAVRSASQDILDFVDVLFICRETGGDTVKAVNDASVQIMEKIEIQKDILVATSQKKFEAKILSCLPPVILLFLNLSTSDYLSMLYGNIAGICIMSVALGLMCAAFYWSTKISDIRV
jgi:tight adherence protein B